MLLKATLVALRTAEAFTPTRLVEDCGGEKESPSDAVLWLPFGPPAVGLHSSHALRLLAAPVRTVRWAALSPMQTQVCVCLCVCVCAASAAVWGSVIGRSL